MWVRPGMAFVRAPEDEGIVLFKHKHFSFQWTLHSSECMSLHRSLGAVETGNDLPANSLPPGSRGDMNCGGISSTAQNSRRLFGTQRRSGTSSRAPCNMLGRLHRRVVGGSLGRASRSEWCRGRECVRGLPEFPRVAESRSEEHTSELQSHSFISYAVF